MALKPRGEQPSEPEKQPDSPKQEQGPFARLFQNLNDKDQLGLRAEATGYSLSPDEKDDLMGVAMEAATEMDELIVLHDKMVMNPGDRVISEAFVTKMKEIVDGDERAAITIMSAGISALSLLKNFMGGTDGFPKFKI